MTTTWSARQAHLLRQGLRQAAIALLVLFLLLVTLRSAFALSITSVTAPATIAEGRTLHLSFAADGATGYAILKDGAIVSANSSYDHQLGYDEAGAYVYTFQATDGRATASENRTVQVTDVPLTVTLLAPNQSDYEQHAIPIAVATDIPAGICYAATSAGTNTLEQANATAYNGTVTLPDGVQTITAGCTRGNETATANATIHIDTTPPTMTLGPAGTLYDDAVTLSATTDEPSDCRYDTAAKPYAQMAQQLPGTASLSHQQTLSLGSGSYGYYVSCEDVYGNAADPQQVNFTVQNPPSAKITVDGSNPHKAGTYKVTLTTSEPLAGMPALTLTYQGGASQTLALSQADSETYEGYIIVPDDAGEQVGSFQFSGKDEGGLTGTAITDGELFMVDTVKPATVQTFKAVNGTGAVNLTWYYDAPGETTFNIYRSTQPGVDYTDYLASATGGTGTAGGSYLDTDTRQSVVYYYRIAAVDAAGNVGDLSHEEWASPATAAYQAQDVAAALDPVLQVGLDQRLNELEAWTMDAQRAAGDLGAETDKDKSGVIVDLGLLDAAQKAVQTLTSAKTDLEQLRTLALTKQQFDDKVTAIEQTISAARAGLALKVDILQKASYQEVPDQQSVDAAAALTLQGTGESEDAYLKAAAALQAATSIRTSVTQVHVSYADGSEHDYTIVSKRLSASEPQQDVVAVETVPKEMAATASDLTFIGGQPVVLQQDPVLQYSFGTLTQGRIAYAVKQAIDPAVARGATLVLLPKPTQQATAQQPAANETSPTGMAILSSISSIGGGQLLLAAIGLVIVAGLLVYYLSLRNDGEEGWPFGQQRERMPKGAAASDAYPFSAGFPAGAAPGTIPQGVMPGIMPGITPPFLAPPQRPRTIVIERRQEPLAGLLTRSHALIDGKRYLDALYFYKRAVEQFRREPFPSAQLKEATRRELELLHAKLSLFDTAAKAHDAAYAEDARQLAQLMERMRGHAAAIGEQESPLVSEAKLEYDYLYRRLNALRMDEEMAEGRGTE